MNVSHDYKGHERAHTEFICPSKMTLDAADIQNSGKSISGVEAFTFDYDVQWPMSLILSKRVCLMCIGSVTHHDFFVFVLLADFSSR
jgi:hypothetical protein